MSGEITENGELLNVGGSVTVTFSSGSYDAEGAVSYTVPVVNGKYTCEVPALTADNEFIWAEWSGDGDYAKALVMDKINIYEISVASVYVALAEENVKQFYETGDKLNVDNLYIWIFWMDGTEEEIPVTADMVSGFDSSKAAELILTVDCPYPYSGEITYEVWIKEKESYLLGDVNLDGRVDISDVTAMQRHFAEIELLDDQALSVADVNGDGAFTIDDATHLQRFLAEYDVVLGKQ